MGPAGNPAQTCMGDMGPLGTWWVERLELVCQLHVVVVPV